MPGSSGKENAAGTRAASDVPASSEVVRLSVLKELWFPILRNFTGLITEKSEAVRNEALDALEKTFEEHHAHFGESLWREIFSQVLFPVLEDIRLQVELATRKSNYEQAQHHITTLQLLMASMNSFLIQKQESLPPALHNCYMDVICLFASLINNQELAAVVMDELKILIVEIGSRFVVPEQWDDVIEQISLLFQAALPRLLADEMENSQSQEMSDMIGDDNNKASGRSMGGQPDSRLKFEQCYAKCTVQLRLTKVVAEIISSFFDQLSIEQV